MKLAQFLLHTPMLGGFTITIGNEVVTGAQNISRGRYFAVEGQFYDKRVDAVLDLINGKQDEDDDAVSEALDKFEEYLQECCPDFPEELLGREVMQVFPYYNIENVRNYFAKGYEWRDAVPSVALPGICISVLEHEGDEELWESIPAHQPIMNCQNVFDWHKVYNIDPPQSMESLAAEIGEAFAKQAEDSDENE